MRYKNRNYKFQTIHEKKEHDGDFLDLLRFCFDFEINIEKPKLYYQDFFWDDGILDI